jgi:hypothetical protein
MRSYYLQRSTSHHSLGGCLDAYSGRPIKDGKARRKISFDYEDARYTRACPYADLSMSGGPLLPHHLIGRSHSKVNYISIVTVVALPTVDITHWNLLLALHSI